MNKMLLTLALVFCASAAFADGSDPMPLCRLPKTQCPMVSPAVQQASILPTVPQSGPMPLCDPWKNPNCTFSAPSVTTHAIVEGGALLLAVGQPPPDKCCFETKYGPYCCS
jgi:hypothetical protein